MVWGGGWIGTYGAVDFAGGLVVHMSSGFSALVAAKILVEGLKAAGAEVFETQVYEIAIPVRGSAQEELIQAILDKTVDAVVFTSSMMVRNFLEMASQMGCKDEVIGMLNDEGVVVAAIGHPTSNTLNIYKIQVNIISNEYTFNALINETRKSFIRSDLHE